MMRMKQGTPMLMKRVAALMALLMAALPCAAAEWKSLRRNATAMLSVDTQSIQRKADEVTLQYLVDFRASQANADGKSPYRSIVVSAKVNCAKRAIALVNTDAYAQYGAKGVIIAKTALSAAEASYKPLDRSTSDEDVWRYACEEKKARAKK